MTAPLRSISVFHAVARSTSISKAAEELAVTPSAVSQQIRVLEEYLGTTLLTKAGRRIKLTEAGERYFEMISEKVEQISEATDRLRGQHAVASLRIRATPTFSTKWLLPRLQRFLDRNSQLEVRLDGTNEPTDFRREDVDIEIRHGEGNWPGLFVEGIAREAFLPACAPTFLRELPIPIEQIIDHQLIHSVKSQVQWESWLTSAGMKPAARWRRVLFDRSHMAIDAAAAGMGIALESTLMMWRELQEGRLICPIIDPPHVVKVTQWIVCPHDHLRHSKVRAFNAWIKEESDIWHEQMKGWVSRR